VESEMSRRSHCWRNNRHRRRLVMKKENHVHGDWCRSVVLFDEEMI
jgi:hypothetical protein